MKHYPLFADLHQRPVLLVGGGHVAERKAEMLLQAGARLRVVAPALSPQLAAWQQAQKLEHIGSHFDAAQLAGVFLVVAATDSPTQNHTVFAAAEAAAKLCNCVDDVAHCSFIVPAVVDRSPLQIAISSGGAAPVLARQWRQQIECTAQLRLPVIRQIRLVLFHAPTLAARQNEAMKRCRVGVLVHKLAQTCRRPMVWITPNVRQIAELVIQNERLLSGKCGMRNTKPTPRNR